MAIDPRTHNIDMEQSFKLVDRFRILYDISESNKAGVVNQSPVGKTDFYTYFYNNISKTDRKLKSQGSDIVLEALGVRNKIETIKKFAPDVTFKAETVAKNIFLHIKDGTLTKKEINDNIVLFEFPDFGTTETDYGTPTSLFDFSSIEDFASNLATGVNEISNVISSAAGVLNDVSCTPTHHADTLIDYGAKYKFHFVVEFHFQPSFDSFSSDIAFVVKNSTRPNINAEYEEINMYNFRTRVPKKTTYEPMTMRFYDDNGNHAMQFWDAYQKAIIPISNVDEIDPSTSLKYQTGSSYEASVNAYAGSYGVPPDGSTTDILSYINLFHVYDAGRKMNVYKFHNPRIQRFTLDDVDMTEGGSANEIEIQFLYDALFTITDMTTSSIHEIETNGINAGSGGNSSSVDYESGFSAASSGASGIFNSASGILSSIGSIGTAIGAVGGAYSSLTGNSNPLATVSNRITGAATAIQGNVNQVSGLVNLGTRTVNTLTSAGRSASSGDYSTLSGVSSTLSGAASAVSQISGVRTEATRTVRSLSNILNI